MILEVFSNLGFHDSMNFSSADHEFTASPQAVIAEPETCGFRKFLKIPKKDGTPRKFKLADQREFGKREGKKRIATPWTTLFCKLSVTSTVWNISVG